MNAAAARLIGCLFLAALSANLRLAAAAGSLSGIIKDPSGASVPHAQITLVNSALKSQFKATSDTRGFYSFPALPVGGYDLRVEAAGFRTQEKTNLAVDTDAALKIDVQLEVGRRSDIVTVTASEGAIDTQVESAATHLGEVVSQKQIEALPLNGRSYTDLLAIQPGVSPVSTLTPTSVIMAGVTGTINPSGDLNPGDVSIDGQRESANGFMVNATDVQEHMNGGTSVIPNLDSIQEFRVLTNNFDPEYGNYNGGMINVITRSGSNSFHGDAFEFLRNTTWTRAISSIPIAARSARTSSAALSADLSSARNSSSLSIIKAPEPFKGSPRPRHQFYRCRSAPATSWIKPVP